MKLKNTLCYSLIFAFVLFITGMYTLAASGFFLFLRSPDGGLDYFENKKEIRLPMYVLRRRWLPMQWRLRAVDVATHLQDNPDVEFRLTNEQIIRLGKEFSDHNFSQYCLVGFATPFIDGKINPLIYNVVTNHNVELLDRSGAFFNLVTYKHLSTEESIQIANLWRKIQQEDIQEHFKNRAKKLYDLDIIRVDFEEVLEGNGSGVIKSEASDAE